MRYFYHDSPLGPLLLAASQHGLHQVGFPPERLPDNKTPVLAEDHWLEDATPFAAVRQQLDQYFAGKRRHFDLPLDPTGTAFQRNVLRALQDIPYGKTCTYGDIAIAINRPKAVRAVGAANGRNPIPIIIPCHRVIGADGSLTGFGGGLPAKRWLLELEGSLPVEQPSLW